MEQQLKAPPEVKKVAEFLRGSGSGVKTRVGALSGKRLDYFKGKSAVKALLSPAYAKLKNVPKVSTEEEAEKLLQAINAFAFFLRVQRGGSSGSSSNSPKLLQIVQEQGFKEGEYYAWFYEGSQWTTYAGGVLMVLIMLAGVMFPLWPPVMRLGVWYLSMGMLGLIGVFFGIAIVRLIFYIITIVVASPGIWIFPQLFADVGFVDSFIPLWEWDIPKKKTKKRKGEKKEGKSKSKGSAPPSDGDQPKGAFIEEVNDDEGVSSDQQPQKPPRHRSAMIEEVDDEDA